MMRDGQAMPRGPETRLCGRDGEMSLVREFLHRPDQDGSPVSRRLPALVFSGARGSGKTALLGELARLMEQNVPFARLDCERIGPGSAQQSLAAVAFQLSRPCKDYGVLEFPRFITGELALRPNLDVTNWQQARAEIDAALAQYSDISDPPELLHELAGEVLTSVPGLSSIPGMNTLGQRSLSLVVSVINAVRRRRGLPRDGRQWYGHQDKGLSGDALNVLVDLNREARQQDAQDSRDGVGELLWAAFLADLREGFRAGRQRDRRTLNCALLLDNVEAAPGIEILTGLLKARRQRAAFADAEADPLTVVATTRTGLSGRLADIGEHPVPTESVTVSSVAGKPSPEGKRAPAARLVRLDDLTAEHVGNMVAALGPHLSSSRRIATVVHGFTLGHPRATRLLLDTIAEHDLGTAELSRLLAMPVPRESEAGPAALADLLLEDLLQGTPADVVEDVVTSAAARDLDQAYRLATYSSLLPGAHHRHAVVFDPALWSRPEPDGTRTMPVVLRRLLLRRLVGRREHHADWASVHGWLRRRCEQHDDETGELHHALALGEVEFVSRRLAKLLGEQDIADWLELLRSLRMVPNALAPTDSPIDRVRELSRWAAPADQPIAALARLVAALWTDADPLSRGDGRALHTEIAADLDEIAPYAGDGLGPMRAEADKFR